MQKIKIIFMGTPDFALLPLKALIEHPIFDIEAVVTQPDKKIGRKQILTEPPVKTLAQNNNLTVLQPENIKNNGFYELIKNLKPDFIVVVAYGKLLPKKILDIPKYECVNIHASLLPKYRGASPIHETLLNGDEETGISIIKIGSKLDEGEIYYMQRIKIEPKDDIQTLYQKLSMLGAMMLPFVLMDIRDNNTKPLPQGANASYCKKITKEDGLIDWNKSAKEIHNKIRAFKLWPNCYTFLGKKMFKILDASILSGKASPGEIIFIDKEKIGIGSGEGLLIPKKIQLEGKKAILIKEFLKGYTETLRDKKSFTNKR